MKIVVVVGVRPEFVQCAPLLRELKKFQEIILIHTGQHYDYEMSKQFFEQLGVPEPNYYLSVGSGNHGFQTGEMIKKLEEIMLKEMPNIVLVFGDTNSTLAGALSASKLHIKVGHIESGMRSFDKSMPEEINRILTDHCSDLLFCSTKTAVDNLFAEGIKDDVFLTGDVMVDSLLYNQEIAERESNIFSLLFLKKREYLVATIHRASNTDNEENLTNIIYSFLETDEQIVFPIHPRTQISLRKFGLYEKLENKPSIKITKPLSYLDFLKLASNAKKILTDSGGIQKEAYILKIPCITLRENTEWVETVEDRWNILVGADKEKILSSIQGFNPNTPQRNVFGCNSSRKIANCINFLE